IKQNCSSGANAGFYGPVKVTTPCAVYTANFVEDFDSTPVGTGSKAGSNYPTCWGYIDSVTTGYGYVMTSNPQSSPNVYRMYRTNTATGGSQELVLVSPQTDNLGNGTKQLRFSVRSYITTTYINQLEILSMPDPTTTAGATVLATVYNDNTNGQVWKEYIVPLPATTDDYFAFKLAYNGTTTASSVTIDDVYYEDLGSCIFPMNLDATNITSNSADISWDASIATGVTDYYYEVRDTAGTVVDSGTVTGTTAPTTGLAPGTEYTVYIRSVCGTSNGDWTTFPVTFQTPCVAVTTNFFEDFDALPTGTSSDPSIPTCWTYLDSHTGYGYT